MNVGGMHGLGAGETTSGQPTWMTGVENLIKSLTGGAVAVTQARTAIQLQNLNVTRAKQGLMPIDSGQYQQMYAPPVYQSAAAQTVRGLGSTQNLVLMGGAVALVMVLLMMRRK